VCTDLLAPLLENNNISSTPPQSLSSGTSGPRLIKSIKTLPKPITNVFKNAYFLLHITETFPGSGSVLMLLNLNKTKIKLRRKAFCTEYKRKATA
jgi:hypothetical protein